MLRRRPKSTIKPVRIGAVRQLIDGMRRYECSSGLVVTNHYFTAQAVECAATWDIDLWDRRVLAEFLEGDVPEVDLGVCAECNAAVTKGVADWCLAHPARYEGAVYCRKHQARSRRTT